MISLDTNYLLRFFTNDVKSQAQIAKRLIKGSSEIYLSVIAIAETVYFLRNHFEKSKDEVCEELSLLIKQPSIKTQDFVSQALLLYRSENISFYDSLLLSEALEEKLTLRTFDKKLTKVFDKYQKGV
ncbi:MAG: PIN domain protein [Microgenomates group bacterium GW2011_GWC1_37_8]|uniref:PIN domain protein n=1 Tax=Candidatus Woesebacteria bacterium GW2011_GWB1_38_8 TaxID=1618570 RepID=A0A0G0LDP4_9BACT|nr:MAG: PIN domain protein [Microgenomates group bacterium GW2011_GWC1_37_8]KKQ86045.1 MAG: PIN domain protein [Candidatus Woesebacteria bacterium GW2011_GWB1_38_8]